METDPNELVPMIRRIRAMKDPEKALAALAEIRSKLPLDAVGARKPRPELDPRLDGITAEDFAWDAVQEAVESILAEVQSIAQAKRQALLEHILDLYYAMEEASRDPKNAHLIPHVERMRAAYFRDYGHAIPTKEETEKRRRGS